MTRQRYLVFALMVPLVAGSAAARNRSERIEGTRIIEGIPCTDLAWWTEDGRLDSCYLAQDTRIGRVDLPKGTSVGLDEKGRPSCVFLPGDSEVQGLLLRGHGHDYQTCFHPNGKLRFGNLRRDTEIQGISCRRATFLIYVFIGNAGVTFHESGSLKGCLMAEDATVDGKTFRKGDRIELDEMGVPRPSS